MQKKTNIIKKILIIKPMSLKVGQPSYERITSFENFYKENGIDVYVQDTPVGLKQKINFVRYI